MKPLVALLLLVSLAGCEQQPSDTEPVAIRDADGCTVYQFRVDGMTHYFTRCADQVTTDRQYEERHGKVTDTETESIPTYRRK